jgi:hypothetical protein
VAAEMMELKIADLMGAHRGDRRPDDRDGVLGAASSAAARHR